MTTIEALHGFMETDEEKKMKSSAKIVAGALAILLAGTSLSLGAVVETVGEHRVATDRAVILVADDDDDDRRHFWWPGYASQWFGNDERWDDDDDGRDHDDDGDDDDRDD